MANAFGSKYTQEELRAAFEKVQHPENWKFGNKNVVIEANEVEIVGEAVVHFTGGVMEYYLRKSDGKAVVKFEGYYTCVGA
jgi:hypothetical protein